MSVPCKFRKFGFVLLSWLLATSAARADNAALINSGKKATAFVLVRVGEGRAMGSAFCVDAAMGLFVTNAHVVTAEGHAPPGSRPQLVLNPGQTGQRTFFGTVLKSDDKLDLAIIKIEHPTGLTALEIGDDSALVETAPITVFGYPLGDLLTFREGQYPSISVSVGRVTALRRDRGELEIIQVDAAVTHGNSGGPVLDEKGRVVGILSAGLKDAGAISFAIPVSQLVRFLRHSDITVTPNLLPAETAVPTVESPTPTVTQEPIARVALPDPAALAKADQALREVYATELKDISPAARRSLSRRLLDQAGASANDATARCAMLLRSRDLAIDAGDVRTALDAFHELARQFDIDSIAAEMDLLHKLAPKPKTQEDQALFAADGLLLIDQLLAAERYADIAPIAGPVQSAASQSHNAPVATRVHDRLAFAQTVSVEYVKIKPALSTLRTKPDDPDANTAAGKFYAVQCGEWDKALPLLAKASDKAWMELAKRELAKPTDAAGQADLANGWWDLAEKQTAAIKARLRTHAVAWYSQAIPKLQGLARTLAEKRLESTQVASDGTSGPSARTGHTIDLLKLFDARSDAAFGQWSTKDGLLLGGPDRKDVVRFPYRPADEYDCTVEFKAVNADWSLAILLPRGEHEFRWGMGGQKEKSSRFGPLPSDAEASQFYLENGRRYVCRVEVRDSGAKAFIDDELICTYSGAYRDLVSETPLGGDPTRVGILTWWNHVTIYRAEVTEFSSPGTILHGAP